MAYAAVVSLLQILDNIQQPHLAEHQIPHDKQQIESLQEKLNFFCDFLDDSWQRHGTVVRCLERKIRDAMRKAQDIVELNILEHTKRNNEIMNLIPSRITELEVVTEEIDSVKKKVSILKDLWDATGQHQTRSLAIDCPSRLSLSNDNILVGFHDDWEQLKDHLVGQPSKLQIIPLIGMGGSGKSSLAKNLYEDEHIVHHFDVRAWVTVSQNYRLREMLLGILDSMRKLNVEMHQESEECLMEQLYKSLKGWRYLIVIDDVWDTKVWNEVGRLFPDDFTGSRIMLTTRLSHVAAIANSYRSYQHHMHFLNEQQSWNLFCSKVFMEECCPAELEEAGKKIAKTCKGLPLAIVVISGLLSKVPMTQTHWEYFAQNVHSYVNANEQCSEILSMSYNHLPHHLKACFLYMGGFPEDHQILISKLVKLWIAEGFLKPESCKSLEEVAEEYLEDLISRNLVLVGRKRCDGKIKTCTIHDMLRDLCLRKAKEEKFLHFTNTNAPSFLDEAMHSQRLSMHGGIFSEGSTGIFKSLGTLPLLRSLLYSGPPCVYRSGDFLHCELLRVLDFSDVDVGNSMDEILKLVHLRYLAFSCSEDILIPKSLPNCLWHLQTLIINQRSNNNGIAYSKVYLPPSIWNMTQLRHLQFGKSYFISPLEEVADLILENLQSLLGLSSYSCTEELFKRTPNLKKLGLCIEQLDTGVAFSPGNLCNLSRLEVLKCFVEPGEHVSMSMNFVLPQNLKRLTLSNTRISWEDMPTVGMLPNLQVLKLKNFAFEGEEWKTRDGEFCQLKYLLIDGAELQFWSVDDKDHFPRLEHLVLWECPKLEGIPSVFGDITMLQMIELDDASLSAVNSAKQIQMDQQYLGNEALQVCVLHIWEPIIEKRKEWNEAKKRERVRADIEFLRYRERVSERVRAETEILSYGATQRERERREYLRQEIRNLEIKERERRREREEREEIKRRRYLPRANIWSSIMDGARRGRKQKLPKSVSRDIYRCKS